MNSYKLVSAKLVRKGGEGSGNFGHEGRPGEVGGSQAGSGAIGSALGEVANKADISLMGYKIEPTPGPEWGKYDKANHAIWIDEDKIRQAIKSGDEYYIQSWTGMSDALTYDNLLRHVVAHETGHYWWYKHHGLTQDLHKFPGGYSAKRETNPTLRDWQEKIYPKYKNKMSGYARRYDSKEEAFCDAFANWATGNRLDPAIQSWFDKNIK